MLNWRSIEKEGCPLDYNKTYLVTDGINISTSDIDVVRNYNTGEVSFRKWLGDENTYEDNSCCSGTRMFDLFPTHWCPVEEINLP